MHINKQRSEVVMNVLVTSVILVKLIVRHSYIAVFLKTCKSMTQNDIIFIGIIDQNSENKKYLSVRSKYFELFTSYELGFKKIFSYFFLKKKEFFREFYTFISKVIFICMHLISYALTG